MYIQKCEVVELSKECVSTFQSLVSEKRDEGLRV